MASAGFHGRRVGLQPGQRRLVRRKLAAPNAAGVDHRDHLPGFHQHALGVAEQFGVALGGALVKSLDRAGVAGLLPQSRPACAPPAARAVNPATGIVRRIRPGAPPIVVPASRSPSTPSLI